MEDTISEVAKALASEEQAADLAFSQSRKIIRKTKTAIHGIHVGKRDPELIDSISSDIAGLIDSLKDHPRQIFGTDIETAMSEFAETVIYDYTLRNIEVPSYTDLEITPSSWLLGLADSIGELRRDMLKALMNGELEKATAIFSGMETLSDALMTFDVKESVAPIRRKQDIARGLMERSRSDLATAIMLKR